MHNLINIPNLKKSLKKFHDGAPFHYTICDNFFNTGIAKKLEKEFPTFNSKLWHEYKNPLEVKKTLNNWNIFPELTYLIFSLLNSEKFIAVINNNTNLKKLYPDIGLNGGGWHIHKKGGKLNPHLDYSIHPKLGLQRKLNIIIFLSSNWKVGWKGHLGLWKSNAKKDEPEKLIKKILPRFNRAVIFDTTQNSWHGICEDIKCPEGHYRKSIAVYYLQKPKKTSVKRTKALFAPIGKQRNKEEIISLIKKRSSSKGFKKAYRAK